MAKKFYVVRKGKTPGIYENWADCKAQVDGFSGADFKSFLTLEEAKVYYGHSTDGNPEKLDIEALDEISAIAYVDGSYNVSTKEFSYGVVFIAKGKEIEFSQKGENEELALMRNVAGEIKGAEAAMRYALENQYKKLTIYHDYEGISKWCQGAWKTNKEGTIAYKRYYDSIKRDLEIQFVKVKGHSNDKYNDRADALAKREIM